MFEHKRPHGLNDYFKELNNREEKGVFFCRLTAYSDEAGIFLKRYYSEAVKTGAVIEGKLQNPDGNKLEYYEIVLGKEFKLERDFIFNSLKKWLPQMKDFQRMNLMEALFNGLNEMGKAGKTENILKNTYIKYMCWFYYRFSKLLNHLGEMTLPKVLYDGEPGYYDLMLLRILSNAGADVLLLEQGGDSGYQKYDSESVYSDLIELPNRGAFPEGYGIGCLKEEVQRELKQEKIYGALPKLENCTNAWIGGKGFEDIQKDVALRGSDKRYFYNCFIRIIGVEDKLTYVNELFSLQRELKSRGRKTVTVSGEIEKPRPEEISRIFKRNYNSEEELIVDLGRNIRNRNDSELQNIMHKAFVDIVSEEAKKLNGNLRRLYNRTVYLLCWLKRYQQDLLADWRAPEIGCFIYLGGCRDDSEAMFLRFLSRLPIDVLILCPNLNSSCCLTDSLLYEIHNSESLSLDRFPDEDTEVRIGTAAYHAERDLDKLMYDDSLFFRNQQYGKAKTVSLQTMYEEIRILWDQELKYRPGFEIVEGVVVIPVIYAKVSGIKDRNINRYFSSISELWTENAILITSLPYLNPDYVNPFKGNITDYFRNGRVQRDLLKNHPKYPYGILRDEVQELIFDKLQMMIDQKLIKGIGENGTEYTVIATVMNLPREIQRLIQKFDFTKKNPKLIFVNTTESILSKEDSILTAFLNLLGFDIVFFIPTGYQSIEKYYNKLLIDKHEIGEYVYDLQVPDLMQYRKNASKPSFFSRIFGG